MQRVIIGRTENTRSPLRHRFLWIGPFEPGAFQRYWKEIFSWNPKGHNTKIMCNRLGKDYYAVVMWANPKFRDLLIEAAKYYIPKPIYFYGNMEISMELPNKQAKKMERYRTEEKKANTDYDEQYKAYCAINKKRNWAKLDYKPPQRATAKDKMDKLENLFYFIKEE